MCPKRSAKLADKNKRVVLPVSVKEARLKKLSV